LASSSLFDPNGMRAGAVAATPLALSCAAYGVIYGIVARGVGWSVGDVLVNGLVVFAGASQLTALQMWHDPAPYLAIVIATVAVNLRYSLVGASLRGVFANASPRDKILGIHFVADENWVVTIAAVERGEASPAFLLGGGLTVALWWVGSGIVGCLLGGQVPTPERWGLDFAFTAAFTVMAMSLRSDRRDMAVWSASALGAILGDAFLGGAWFVIAGTTAGVIVRALTWRADDDE